MKADIRTLDVIAPNLKRRYSGVTSTVLRLVPIQARDIAIAAAGPVLPDDIPRVPLSALPFMPRNRSRVWHARRNVEMLAGLVLRGLFRRRLKLLFTSAAQRRHTGWTRWMISRMDAVVATSGKSAAFLDREAQVIRHGVDTEMFAPVEDRAALRRSLGLPEDALLVGCFGRLRPQKGTDLFVDAMLRLLPRHRHVTAILMGGVTADQTSFVAGLRERIAQAGLSERLLILPEDGGFSIAPWFAALDLYVTAPLVEGFGLTVLEAMAAGVPVVASRAGAFEELVAEGETGLLVPPGDGQALGGAIGTLLDDRSALLRMASAARPHVLRNFRIEGEAAALNDVYRRLLRD